MPTGFNYTNEYHEMYNTTITLQWDPPGGEGPEAVVDFYTISISPAPLHPDTNMLNFSLSWNVTLAHNVIYTINITAGNCAGESDPFVLPDIEFSRLEFMVSPVNLRGTINLHSKA